ncbi:mucoidy inhibitor a [Moniliophthora roreri]|uniref:Mucoidy inhibitor a n=1 Tax=Moniliophthora roreri TaxID=221103 RepID=A0A0W0EY62_MONRR|nr:mucoidy inhibitor a [Moniliophthora roreri]
MSPHIVEVVSTQDGEIQSVSVYTGRAEITRRFSFEVEEGQNQVNITGLPNVLEEESIRVEGRGHAIIHDVTIPRPRPTIVRVKEETASPFLKELEDEKELISNALRRHQLSELALESFIKEALLNIRDPSGIGSLIDSFNQAGAKVDEDKVQLRARLDEINVKISAERKRIHDAEPAEVETSEFTRKLGLQLGVGVFAEKKGNIELIVTYAVTSVSWDAFYDVRVSTLTKEDGVTLEYKANIKQDTGESWENVELTLETATPSYNSKIPELKPWNISQYIQSQPVIVVNRPMYYSRGHSMSRRRSRSPSPSYERDSRSSRSRSRSPIIIPAQPAMVPPPMPTKIAEPILGKGNISATFRVPGKMTIPGDGEAHSVSIAQLKLDAILEWICVPKIDNKVHLKADILNASDYAFVSGNANVYVDGSFISKTRLPAVSPGEKFDCALGLDPSIRITYHPRTTKRTSKSVFGFGQKTITLAYSQRITVQNTKPSAVEGIKVIDQIPVSQDERIDVKLITPELTIPTPQKDTDRKKASSKEKDSSSIKRFSSTMSGSSLKTLLSGGKDKASSVGVTAQWDGVDEPDVDETTIGKYGKINWICSIPPQGTANLVLEWEVSHPVEMKIAGLQ